MFLIFVLKKKDYVDWLTILLTVQTSLCDYVRGTLDMELLNR